MLLTSFIYFRKQDDKCLGPKWCKIVVIDRVRYRLVIDTGLVIVADSVEMMRRMMTKSG